jgi:hypothetical protein
MKIFNVRLGHATNSSSAHSIIICGSKNIPKDKALDGFQLGWQDFIASSAQSKKTYLSILLYQSLKRVLKDERVIHTIINGWVDIKIPFEKFNKHEAYIDHQSLIDLPYNWEGTATDYNFFNEFKNFICRKDVAIVGGNDNGNDSIVPCDAKKCDIAIPRDYGYGRHLVCRKDNNYWTLYNRDSGLKIRMSFDTFEKTEASKAMSPELIDIKITDHCEHNCAFCYQNSKQNGNHCSKDTISHIAKACLNMKVFEVALGGGDPITHPDILYIVKIFREQNVIPNLSTKSVAWLANESFRNEIFENCGAVAFSISTLKEASDVESEFKKYPIAKSKWGYREKFVFHYVMGSSDVKELESILNFCSDKDINIVLLGYKTNGRGGTFKPYSYSNWISIINKLYKSGQCPTIAIDTKLAKEYESSLNKITNNIMVHPEDGKFSMYIDAVNGLAGPSSYCDKSEMKYLIIDGESWNDREDELTGLLKTAFEKY